MAYYFESKIAAIWSIKRETFVGLNENTEALFTADIQSNFAGFKYYFGMEENDGDVVIYVSDHNHIENTNIRELKLSVPSADFEADMSSDADVPEDHKFFGYTNAVILRCEDILNPEKKFFENGILKIEFRGIIECCKKPNTQSLGDILWDAEDKDFKIIVEKKEIKVHKFILRRYSSVFARMFNSNVDEHEIKDFGYDTVYHSIRYCYDFLECANDDALLDCLRFAQDYKMPLIKEQIAHELSEKINTKNVCKVANKSVEFKCPTLKGYCLSFILKCHENHVPFDEAKELNGQIVEEFFTPINHTESS